MKIKSQLLHNRIIQPQDFQFPELEEILFLFFNLEHFYMFKNLVDGGKVRSFGPSRRFKFTWKGITAVAVGGVIGASLAVFILENAIFRGAKKIIAFGTVGWISLQNQKIGALVSPKQTIDQTGLSNSYHLSATNKMADWPNVINCGTLLSINSIFCHTHSDIQNYRSQGIELLDMESAALNAIIPTLGGHFSLLCVISDRIEPDFIWTNGRDHKEFKLGLEKGLLELRGISGRL